jgi:WD40-like Beta Propeller Repeat
VPPIFAADGVEADPWFTSDGRHLYFISTRSTDGVRREDLDIWHVERAADGRWGTPIRLPEPVNSIGREWFPRLAADGWLYFGSDRPGGLGKTDIWRARTDGQHRWTVRNLGPSINSAGHEYEPLISPDGSSMIVMAEGGLYEARRNGAEWTARVKLPPEINVNGSEIGAVYSPSGASLLFSRDTGSPLSGEFFLWRIRGDETWPSPCPAPVGKN